MYTCVRLWVCTCGGVGGGWDVHMCEFVGVYMCGVGGGLGVHTCEFVGMYMWWCGLWLGCTHV